MRTATDAEERAAKAEARKRCGSERLVAIPLGAPFNVEVILAAWDLAAASKHADARLVSIPNAANDLTVDRVVWPAAEDLDALRERWGMLDAEIESAMRREHGFTDADSTVVPLDASTVPPGFASSTKEARGLVDALAAANAGALLWSITNRTIGLSLVLRSPSADAILKIGQSGVEAQRTKSGAITWAVAYARDFCVWAPGGGDPRQAFDRHLDEMPGRADEIGPAMLRMGGAGAARRGRFL